MNAMLFVNAFFGTGPGALIAKATAVLLVATVATSLLPRASAAMRHLVWLAALAGCASLAVLSPVAPPLVVPLPALDDRPVFVDQVAPQAVTVRENGVVSVESFAGRSAHAVARPSMLRRSSSTVGIERNARVFFVAVWMIGCFIVLGRCIVGHVAIARLIRRARPMTSPAWDVSMDAAMVDAGAQRTVDLLISDDVSAPVTTGFIHPFILLPLGADNWSDERRRVVLVHEVAHIVRFDYAAQLVATLAGALFWFHPLAWFAAARLRAEAENAADDRVLAGGTAGVAYAGHLLELARMESGMPLTTGVAVGMVRASRLERRFRAMLDTTRSRAALPRRLPAVATSLTLAAMIPLAGARTTVVPVAHAQRVISVGQHAAIMETRASVTTISVAEPVASAIASPATADTTIDKTIDAAGGGRLTLDLAAGGSVVVHGWDDQQIRMRATLGGRDWRGVRVTLEPTKGGARLQSVFSEATRSWSTDNTFELWVPRHMDIDLSSAGGSLAISDLTGEFRGHTGGGAITIEGASGTATLATGGGDVSVTNSTLGGTVSTGGGGVYISNVSGGLTGSSGSGPVISNGSASSAGWGSSVGYGRATTESGGFGGSTSVSTTTSVGTSDGIRGGFGAGVGRGVGYDTVRVFGSGTTVTNGSRNGVGSGSTVETTTRYTDVRGGVGRSGVRGVTYTRAGGDVVLDEMPNGGRVSTGGGRIYVGSSGGFVSVSSGGGDVELAHMGGDATVWTGSGTVTITVVNTDGTEHSVDVTSGTGRVVLELPRDLDATIELESAYTENFGHKTSIESELALTQSETQAWDDHEGTPRKYVRARGTVGNGRGLIRVRTVNGDILVRRR